MKIEMTVNVNIKWGKEQFKDIEVSLEEPPMVFKAQMFALSGVQPERQKIMVKGQIIKDQDWSNVVANMKNGITLMMMGSADKLPEAPTKPVQFMEDLTEDQLAVAMDLPVGLKNLGNTCYLNAVVQCLKTVPELCSGLQTFKNTSGDMQGSLTLALKDTYEFMEKYKQSDFPPLLLVQLVRTVFPQFATMGEHGPQQQDANECLTEMLRVLQQKIPKLASSPNLENQITPAASSNDYSSKTSSLIEQYFGGEFTCTMKNEESTEEASTTNFEAFNQMSCFISQDVKYLFTGLKLRLEERLTKNSSSLGRDASYLKTSRISRLPGYLNISLVRFYYKEKERVSAKVLKDVKFPMTLDVYDLCTSELQEKLKPNREYFRLQDEENKLIRKADKLAKDQKNIQKEMAGEKPPVDYAPFSFSDDLGSNNSGFYELNAVLTHKGRSSNSGHYVGWSKNPKTNQWYMYDDEDVTPVPEEDIIKLSGGGDWHTAYVLFYGPRKLEAKFTKPDYKPESDLSNPIINETPMEIKKD